MFPIGDAKFENAAHTTFLTKGQGALDGLTCTYSKDRTTFDSATIAFRNRFQAVSQPLDGVDEMADTPDIDAFSRDDASGEGFSIGAGIFLVDASSSTMIAKFEGTGALEEWAFSCSSGDDLRLLIGDASMGVNINRDSNSPLPELVKLNVATVYDGSGGATAMDGVTHYLNGVVKPSTATNNASYVAMEPLSHPVEIGVQNTNLGFMDGQLILPFWTHRQLSAVEVFNLNDIYVAMQRAQRSQLLARII